jgi:hypothetical protein
MRSRSDSIHYKPPRHDPPTRVDRRGTPGRHRMTSERLSPCGSRWRTAQERCCKCRSWLLRIRGIVRMASTGQVVNMSMASWSGAPRLTSGLLRITATGIENPTTPRKIESQEYNSTGLSRTVTRSTSSSG